MKKVIYLLYPFHWNKSIIAHSLEVAPASSGETFEWIPAVINRTVVKIKLLQGEIHLLEQQNMFHPSF